MNIHQAPMDSSKPMLTQMALVKLSGSQTKKSKTWEEKPGGLGMGGLEMGGERRWQGHDQNTLCMCVKLSKDRLNKLWKTLITLLNFVETVQILTLLRKDFIQMMTLDTKGSLFINHLLQFIYFPVHYYSEQTQQACWALSICRQSN